MCSECNTGKWHDEFPKQHWTDYGIEKLLELEARNDGSMINATEYLRTIGEIEQKREDHFRDIAKMVSSVVVFLYYCEFCTHGNEIKFLPLHGELNKL